MANTPNLGLPQNSNWTTGEVESWAKSINDENDVNNAFRKIDDFAGSIYGKSGTVTLLSANWVNKVYTLTVADLGANDAIIFSPVASADKTALEGANIIMAATTGSVTFTAETAPTANIALNYFIARGAA